jgi:endo-alpha-1,4-polygalactosaminidase (GH114 family)
MAAGALLGNPLRGPSSRAFAAPPSAKSIPYVPIEDIPNHRQLMRDVVVALSDYCKKRRPDMVVLVRNAPELLIKERRESEWEAGRDPDGTAQGRYAPVGSIDGPYLNAVDGMLVDGAFYGYDSYETPSRPGDQKALLDAADAVRKQGRHTLSIDYCKEPKHVSDAVARAQKAKLLPYIDTEGSKLLGHVPGGAPASENPNHVTDLAEARNFLPVLSANAYTQRDKWFQALAGTNQDLLLIDPFFHGTSLTVQDITALKYKRIGAKRLVMAPLSVGYASVDRFYWQKGWHVGAPEWIAAVDPESPGRFAVHYWAEAWKKVLGNYVTGLCDLGIDGILLDGLDAYLQFEAMLPI